MDDLNKLNRFTTLSALLDLLKTKRLVFGDPRFWEDKNDSELMREYKERRGVEKLFAICFLEGNETIHHWKTFADRMDGCCIQFDAARLKKLLSNIDGMRCQPVYICFCKLSFFHPSSPLWGEAERRRA